MSKTLGGFSIALGSLSFFLLFLGILMSPQVGVAQSLPNCFGNSNCDYECYMDGCEYGQCEPGPAGWCVCYGCAHICDGDSDCDPTRNHCKFADDVVKGEGCYRIDNNGLNYSPDCDQAQTPSKCRDCKCKQRENEEEPPDKWCECD